MNKSGRRFIDVRESFEFASGHIEGSELVPLRSLTSKCGEWDLKQPLTIVCRSGRRAEQARRQLTARGFQDVVVLDGGVEKWRSQGKSLISAPAAQSALSVQSKWVLSIVLVLISLALAHFVSPWFLLATGIIAVRLVS